MNGDILSAMRQKEPAKLLAEWLQKIEVQLGPALDLGCGVGAEAEYLARLGFAVDAIDKSEMMIKATKERCAGMKVNAILGDFLDFQFKPDYYRIVTAINALPFVPKDQARTLMRYIQASIAPGGAAILVVYGPEHAWADRTDMSFWMPDEFKDIWAGFTIHHFEEFKGEAPLLTGDEIHQHRISIVAQKA